MSIHAAKGLEFEHVFVVGLNDDTLPHKNAQKPHEIEEERRLFYVAITRAKRKLYLSYILKKNLHGEEIILEPSRFLKEIPPDVLAGEGIIFNHEKVISKSKEARKNRAIEKLGKLRLELT